MVGPAPVGNDKLNARLKILNAAYAQEENALDIPYIEIFSHLILDQKYLQESKKNDGYHSGSNGYSAITKIIGVSNDGRFRQTTNI